LKEDYITSFSLLGLVCLLQAPSWQELYLWRLLVKSTLF